MKRPAIPDKVIERLADDIRSGIVEWEADAGQIAQSQQSAMAGEQYLHEKLVECICAALNQSIPD